MKIGICGISYEKCLQMQKANGAAECVPKQNMMCQIATCPIDNSKRVCFKCPVFPCENAAKGPINYGYCEYISWEAQP